MHDEMPAANRSADNLRRLIAQYAAEMDGCAANGQLLSWRRARDRRLQCEAQLAAITAPPAVGWTLTQAGAGVF